MVLKSLAFAVGRALEADAIGTPVALRLLAYNSPNPDAIDQQLAEGVRLSQEWLRSPVRQAHIVGSIMGGERTALLRFEGGQSALISSGVCGATNCQTAAILIGTLGTIAWESEERSGPASADSLLLNVGPPADTIQSHAGPAESTEPAGSTAAKQSPAKWPAAIRLTSAAAAGPTSSAPPPYGILLVAGDHTHQPGYAAAFAADDRCRLIGLTDTSDLHEDRQKRNRELAAQLKIPYLNDINEALGRSDVDVVSVCAEPYRRGDIIERAALAGKHLYLDKPLCGTQEDLTKILGAVRKSRVLAHMFSQVLWHTGRRARALLESGKLGAIVAVHIDLCFAKGPSGTAEPLEARRESQAPTRFELTAAKRELTNIGVYGLVLVLSLLRRNIRSVTASTGNYFFREHKSADMEDFGQVLLELDDEITASVTAGRTGWHSHPRDGVNRIYFLGTRGAATIDADTPRAEIWSAAAASWEAPARNPEDPMGMWATPADSPYLPQPKRSWLTNAKSIAETDVQYFLDCLEQGRESEVSIEIAAAASEALFAAYQSAATGQTILMERKES